jgi:hypothetical protein
MTLARKRRRSGEASRLSDSRLTSSRVFCYQALHQETLFLSLLTSPNHSRQKCNSRQAWRWFMSSDKDDLRDMQICSLTFFPLHH